MAGRNKTPKIYDVFISYSHHSDQAVADRVYQRVIDRRLSCCFDKDKRTLSSGAEWRIRLYRLIQNSKTIILILSPGSIKSKEVRHEINKALYYGAIVCPIVVGSVDFDADLCVLVNDYHWQESNEPPTDEELDQLVDTVAAIVAVDKRPPTISLTSPESAVSWTVGETVRLAWNAQAPEGTTIQQIRMELLSGNTVSYSFPGKNAPWAGSVRECDWTIPADLPIGQYTLRLIAINNLGHIAATESKSSITIHAAVDLATSSGQPAAELPQLAAALPPQVAVQPIAPETTAAVASAPAIRIIDPVVGNRWSLGRLECLRLELTGAENLGMSVDLVLPNSSVRSLVKYTELELRGKLTLAAPQRMIVVAVVVPSDLPPGVTPVRVSLTAADGNLVVQQEVAVDFAQPAFKRISSIEEDECVGYGMSFTAVTLAATIGIALYRQCSTLVRDIDWSRLNVNVSAAQVGSAAWAVIWQNLLLIPIVTLAAGIGVTFGKLLWAEDERKSRGGALIGAGWGAALGLGASLLNGKAPDLNDKLPDISRHNHIQHLGLQDKQSALSRAYQTEFKSSNDFGQVPRKSAVELALESGVAKPPTEPANVDAKSGETPNSLLEHLELRKLKSLPQRARDLSAKTEQAGSDLLYPPSEPLNLSPEILQDLIRTAPAETAETTESDQTPASEPSPPAASTQDSSPATPAPISQGPSAGESSSEKSAQMHAPEWYAKPLKGSWLWALYGTLIGAVLGSVAPFLDEKK